MRWFGWSLAVAALVILDQGLKRWMEGNLPFQQLVELVPFLGLYLTYNKGMAFSFLSGLNDWVLIGFILAVIAFILWLWKNLEPGRWISSLGYALVLGGAIGNLVDRVMLGHVVDFILFYTATWSFAVFNLADVFITMGAAAIIIDEILVVIRSRKEAGNG